MANDKKQRLADLLKSYPHPNHSGEDHRDTIVGFCMVADINGWVDDFIRICEDNPNVTFDEILDLIRSEDRFPPLEIYDDDTGEIIGYGYPGNFPDGQGK